MNSGNAAESMRGEWGRRRFDPWSSRLGAENRSKSKVGKQHAKCGQLYTDAGSGIEEGTSTL